MKNYQTLVYVLLCLSLFVGGLANAVVVDKPIDNPKLELKAREIMDGIRCLVCQNQSIEVSEAGLAQDLRAIIREQILDGKREEEIQIFLVERYGDWVLMKPPFKRKTLLLWFGPLIILIIGILGLIISSRKKQIRLKPLSMEEQKKLKKILDEGGSK